MILSLVVLSSKSLDQKVSLKIPFYIKSAINLDVSLNTSSGLFFRPLPNERESPVTQAIS